MDSVFHVVSSESFSSAYNTNVVFDFYDDDDVG